MAAMIVEVKGAQCVRVTKTDLQDLGAKSFYEVAKVFYGATQLRTDTVGYQSPDQKVKCRLVV